MSTPWQGLKSENDGNYLSTYNPLLVDIGRKTLGQYGAVLQENFGNSLEAKTKKCIKTIY